MKLNIKKSFGLIALTLSLTLSAQAKEQNYLNLPTYFMAPEASYADIEIPEMENTVSFRETTDRPWYPYGLRMLVMKQNPAQLKKSRAKLTQKLYKSGLLDTGDIVLSFRKVWAKTIPYAHIQMGVSHAGLIFVEDGKAYNLDMPLDGEYNGANINSQLDAKHYTDATELHIIRPRDLTMDQKANLVGWIKTLRSNLGKFRTRDALMKFNGDYTAPKHAEYGNKFITTVAKILLGDYADKDRDRLRTLKMYCSEFAYVMLALSNCNPASNSADITDIKDQSVFGEQASCVKEYFKPLPAVEAYEDEITLVAKSTLPSGRKQMILSKHKMVRFTGLLAGPGMIMQHLNTSTFKNDDSAVQKPKLSDQISELEDQANGVVNSVSLPYLLEEYNSEIFTQGDKKGLSRGHSALAEDKLIQQLVGGAKLFYDQIKSSFADPAGNFLPGDIRYLIGSRQKMRQILEVDPELMPDAESKAMAQAAQAALLAIKPNYSPTAYLINAYLPKDHPKRKFDYVATVSFASANDFKRAQDVAKSKKK